MFELNVNINTNFVSFSIDLAFFDTSVTVRSRLHMFLLSLIVKLSKTFLQIENLQKNVKLSANEIAIKKLIKMSKNNELPGFNLATINVVAMYAT